MTPNPPPPAPPPAGPIAAALSFFVPGRAVTKGSHRAVVNRHTGRAVVLPASDRNLRGRLAAWEATVRGHAMRARGVSRAWPTSGPVELSMVFYLPRPRRPKNERPITKPDTSKLLRAAEDGLTGVIFLDDAQVVDLRGRKEYADDSVARPVGVHVTVTNLEVP